MTLERRQFQDLSRFELTDRGRGRPVWFAHLWLLFDALLVRPMPHAFFGWRRFAWRLFGAKIGRQVLIRPGVRVTCPWNTEIGDYCWIGDNATLYSVAPICIGAHSVVSQEAYLCAGTHDYRDLSFPLVASPITIEPECWIAARAFVAPGLRIGRGAVVGACSVVLSDVQPATIVAGVPARIVGARETATRYAQPKQPDDV